MLSTLTQAYPFSASSTSCHHGSLAARSDEQLLTLLRDGSDRAFEVLAARYRARLQRFCWSMLRSNEGAEDAVQDVLVSALRGLRADDRPIQVRPWLYQVARNRCINELRRARKLRFEPLGEEHPHDAPTACERLSSREHLRNLVADVHALPDKQCAALVLREFDGFAYKQIATAMETTVPGVKSLLVRARIGLRASSALREGSLA
jgi:RNA polymerase sigma factor (sigma-70 family)